MSPGLTGVLIFLAVALTAGAAMVSGFEMALFSLRDHHVTALAGHDRKLRATLRLLLSRLESNRVRVLLLYATLNLGSIATVLFVIHQLYPNLDFSWVSVLALVSIIVASDFLPKLVALAAPAWIFRNLAPPFLTLIPVLRPPAAMLEGFVRWVEALVLPARLRAARVSYTEKDYGHLVAIQAEEGTLNSSERELIAEIVKLGNKTVRQCMTARVDAFTLPSTLTEADLKDRLSGGDCWKVPIYGDSPDAITGVLDARRALHQSSGSLQDAVSPPVFVPDAMMALTAFRNYLQEPHSLVIVLDEYGGTEGVLTHEDIIQQIAGDASPASNGNESEIQPLSFDRLLVSGSARLDEVGEALGVDIEERGLDTIGGLVFNRLGKIPKAGERLDLGVVKIVVRKSGEKRIEELLVERPRSKGPSTVES